MENRSALALCSFILLLSCHDDSPEVIKGKLPLKETYFRFDTGEKMAEKSYQYNQDGKVTWEYYRDIKFSATSTESRYEYDSRNGVTRWISTNIDQDYSTTTEYIYDEDKLIRQTLSLGSAGLIDERIDYFYNDRTQPDSSQLFLNSSHGFVYSYSNLWQYDSRDRLTLERRKGSIDYDFITKENQYEGDLLMSTCNPTSGIEGEHCFVNEYYPNGLLFRIHETLPWASDRLLEEYTYAENILREKKIFNQVDMLPAYNADQTRYTIVVRYSY